MEEEQVEETAQDERSPGAEDAEDDGNCCGNCYFWFKQECRFNAPQSRTEPNKWAYWPMTAYEDWCGEYEEDLNSAEEKGVERDED